MGGNEKEGRGGGEEGDGMGGEGRKRGREGEGRETRRGDVEGPGKWSAPGPALALGGPDGCSPAASNFSCILLAISSGVELIRT